MSIDGSLTPVKGTKTVRYRNQAARRVLSVLSAFSHREEPHGVSELARSLGMSKNMVHRALVTLMQEGYVARDRSGQRYQLGYRVLGLGTNEADEFDVGSLSRPALEILHALTGESVYLSIIVGSSRVTIDEIVPPGPRVLRSVKGAQVPLHCTKMSRTLLAHLSDEEIEAYLMAASPLKRAMPTPDPESETYKSVWEDVRNLRRRDYVQWRNPHRSSAAYVIFPLLDEDRRPHAVVTVGGPTERFDGKRIASLLPEMLVPIEALRRQARRHPAPPLSIEGT